MQVRFWGARGSIAVSGEQYRNTGGNTSCIEVEHEGERLILDGGTGLRALGDSLGFGPLRATLLFSHFHYDHVQGVPFFAPAFHPESELVFAAVPREEGALREALWRQMTPPLFPVGLELLTGVKRFVDLTPTQPFEVGPFRIVPVDQPHPNGVSAYRIEAGGQSLVYATDIEHGGEVGAELVEAARGVDLLIHDAQYHWAEYTGARGPSRRGWGHSTWVEAVSAAQRADARQLALFHHDPSRDDEAVDAIEELARERFVGAFAAREGMVVAL